VTLNFRFIFLEIGNLDFSVVTIMLAECFVFTWLVGRQFYFIFPKQLLVTLKRW